MKTTLLYFACFVSVLSLTRCNFNSAPCKNSTIVTSERQVDKFAGIDLGVSANVNLVQGTPQKVILHGATCDLELITTEVSGNTLKIEKKENFFRNLGKITADITVEDISHLSIGGSGDMIAKSPISTTNLKVEIAGSGSVKIDELSAKKLSSTIAGSGSIHISGKDKLEKQEIEISGSGDIFTENMMTTDANVSISGSGSCRIYVTDNLKASIAGSGDVYYKGKPSINSSVAGSGKIKSL